MLQLLTPSFLTPLLCDSAYPWQIGFQDGATPSAEGVLELHDHILFYLIVITVLVFWMLGVTVVTFNSSKVGIVHKYSNHGTLIELIWTITPALVLVAIAFPSFKLLYLLDVCSTEHTDSMIYTMAMTTTWVRTQPVSIGKITTSCTSLVPYGIRGSTIGIRFNRWCLSTYTLTATLRSHIIGHLLGDAHLHMTWSSKNPYFVHTQALARFWYSWSILQLISCMCQKSFTMYGSWYKGSYNTNITIGTRSMPCLMLIHDLFYNVVNGKRKKVIKPELLTYLNTIVLANWAMDDGAKSATGFLLHTEGFTHNEVYMLCGMLHYQFSLVCTAQKHGNGLMIYITTSSMPLFRELVLPHFHPGFYYKLGISKENEL